MNESDARTLFAASAVARLATGDAGGRPHIVPITFALLDPDRIVTAVDHKPKRTTALRRLANIDHNPRVAVLVDHYEDDWRALWWARADGRARVLRSHLDEPDLRAAGVASLQRRYPQYAARPPAGPMVVIEVERWSSWRSS